MQTIKLHTHIGTDGILKLQLPLNLINTELEVLVVLQPALPASPYDWPTGYFEETAGSLAQTPLERPEQGDYEQREALA